MAADKTILQLPAGTPVLTDESVFSDIGGTWHYTFAQLLTLLQANLSVGAVFTFGTSAIPSNTVGNNGDVYVKTDTGQFAQKLSGVWTVVYTIVQGVVGSTIYYGATVPNNANGINGDTYLRTSNGTFYTKITGAWVAEFSMATGPTGPAGANGANGTNGTNGLTILNGITNPVNYTTGVDGDFYINTSTWKIFGPRGQATAGVWPAGIALSFPTITPPVFISIPAGSAYPLVLDMTLSPQSAFNDIPWCRTDVYLLDNPYMPVSGAGAVAPIQKYDVQIQKTFADDTLSLMTSMTIWGYPNTPVSGPVVTEFNLLLVLQQ